MLLMGACLFIGKHFGSAGMASMATGALFFIPIWLAASLLNMWAGISKNNYSPKEEFPIFLLVFSIPAGIAYLIWWKITH
jgi:hypothetical protein